jgi:hypothetical protein
MYKRYAEQLEYYPTLVEAAVEFRVVSRKALADYYSKRYS